MQKVLSRYGLVLIVLASIAYGQSATQVMMSEVPDTAYMLREDGSIFATALIWVVETGDHSSYFVLFPDSSLAGSRQAHDEAVLKAREQRPINPSGTFDAKHLSPQNQKILDDIKAKLQKRQ